MSDFARILAVCRARVTTIPTIRMGVIECKLPMRIVGIVITRAQHTAKIRAKKGCFTAYLALKGCVKHYTVCARTVRSVRPSDIFPKRNRFHSELPFNKPWFSPDVSSDMLTSFASNLLDLNSSLPWPNKAQGQDARNPSSNWHRQAPKSLMKHRPTQPDSSQTARKAHYG
jgi:hypothetical protein